MPSCARVIVPAVLSAVAAAALARPRVMLGGAVVVLLACGYLALDAPQRLGLAPPEAPATQSANASEELTGALGREPEPGMLIVTNGRDPATSGPYEIALEVLTA